MPPPAAYSRGAGVYAPPVRLPPDPSWGFGKSIQGGIGRWLRNVGRGGEQPEWRRKILEQVERGEIPRSYYHRMSQEMPANISPAQAVWGAGLLTGVGGIAEAAGKYPEPPAYGTSVYEMATGPRSPGVVEHWQTGHPWIAGLQGVGAVLPGAAYGRAALRSAPVQRGIASLRGTRPVAEAGADLPDPTRRALLAGGIGAVAAAPFAGMRRLLTPAAESVGAAEAAGTGARAAAAVAAPTVAGAESFLRRLPNFWTEAYSAGARAANVAGGRISERAANLARRNRAVSEARNTEGVQGLENALRGPEAYRVPYSGGERALPEIPRGTPPPPELNRVADEFFHPHGALYDLDIPRTRNRPRLSGELDPTQLDPAHFNYGLEELDTLTFTRMDELLRQDQNLTNMNMRLNRPSRAMDEASVREITEGVAEGAETARQAFLPNAIAQTAPRRVLNLQTDEFLTEGIDPALVDKLAEIDTLPPHTFSAALTKITDAPAAARTGPFEGRHIARYYVIDDVPVVTLSYSDDVLRANNLNRAHTDIVIHPSRAGILQMITPPGEPISMGQTVGSPTIYVEKMQKMRSSE